MTTSRSRPVSQLLTESRVTDALTYLSHSDETLSAAKAQVARSEFMAKVSQSMAFKALQAGSVEDKKSEALMSKDVQEAWNKHFDAVVQFETIRARREREVLIIDVWRSINANRRQGNV
jgi:hypothetical protein